MSYLQPPPNMSPVVVVKDFGGYVDQYAAMTEMYRRTNREVRIHECHSACTMALSLPNVCVYPRLDLQIPSGLRSAQPHHQLGRLGPAFPYLSATGAATGSER